MATMLPPVPPRLKYLPTPLETKAVCVKTIAKILQSVQNPVFYNVQITQ